MKRIGKKRKNLSGFQILIVILMISLSVFSLRKPLARSWQLKGRYRLWNIAQCSMFPVLMYQYAPPQMSTDLLAQKALYAAFPVVGYVKDQRKYETEMEDEETIQMILALQAEDENQVDENGNLIAEGSGQEPQAEQPAEANAASGQLEAAAAPVLDLSIERLRDPEYLMNNFYTVDSTTMIDSDQLNVDDLLGRSMKIDCSTGGAKVLIFHTHSQEFFADSVEGDASTSIVGVGGYLTEKLKEKGIETIHDEGVYDIINGKLDRSNAYEMAEAGVRPILEANPTVEIAIDLHRDGVGEDTHLITDIGGTETAKIMFFDGLSRTRTQGDIAYLYNPYIQDNLAFSLQMQLACETYYPGFARHIYLKGYRYNLHLLPKSLLIEAGAQTNTVQEMKNAMDRLAEILYHVIM
ncbi:MAG: stage II sporulation protein P [Hespellia sp.]|nr:stage II sporulation protein P [Hespellia sp.]